MLIVFRAVQGLTGGGLQPVAQAILNDEAQPSQRAMAFALFGMAVVAAPAIGPTLGGWITDNYDWRWVFLINLPVGAVLFFLLSMLDRRSARFRRRSGSAGCARASASTISASACWRSAWAACRSCSIADRKTTGSARAFILRWPSLPAVGDAVCSWSGSCCGRTRSSISACSPTATSRSPTC